MAITQLDAITKFLESEPTVNRRWHKDLEVQVLVRKGEGERVDSSFQGVSYHSYTDGINTWKSLRIPYNAKSSPEYTDKPQTYPLDVYSEGIGTTGWNWKTLESEFFGYDFDSLVGHKSGLSQQDMDEVIQRAMEIPWVSMIRSTSGRGIHIFVDVHPRLPAKNHNEHAANARLVLNYLCAKARFDFKEKVDCLGGIMWLWHEKAVNIVKTKMLSGKFASMEDLYKSEDYLPFKLMKQGEPLTKVPGEFKEQLKIISGKARRPKQANSEFNMLTSTNRHISLGKEHGKLYDWLDANDKMCHWDSDNNMLVCHTADLKTAHDELNMKGIFETNSTGKDSGHDQNCFAFPIKGGAWIVRRHGRDTLEHPYWDKDSSGWTRAFLNKKPSISSVMRAYKGLLGAKGDYEFISASDTSPVFMALGIPMDIPEKLKERTAWVKPFKGKFLILSVAKSKELDGNCSFPGWRCDKTMWSRTVHYLDSDDDTDAPDEAVRDVICEGKQLAWFYKTDSGRWVEQPRTNIEIALKAEGKNKAEIEIILGKCIGKPWEIVSRPFEPEYLGNRLWNKDAAQLAFRPQRAFTGCPTWDRIFAHLGTNLTSAVQHNKWCKANSINTGADWLKLWVACLLQAPTKPLPYMFIYSKGQETGKSTLHEALARLFLSKRGFIRADSAVVSSGGFNGELAKAVLCVIEETDLNQSKLTLERIKDWVTSETISIHKKGREPYMLPNTTHWIQCANNERFVPVTKGDTRITMIHVNPLKKQLPRDVMHRNLEIEAPAFLYDMLNMEIPQHDGRLMIPCIETTAKTNLALEDSQSALDAFIAETMHFREGHLIAFDDFFKRFRKTLPVDQQQFWTNNRVSREMPTDIPRGRAGNSRTVHLGNVTWDSNAENEDPPYRVSNSGNLVRG